MDKSLLEQMSPWTIVPLDKNLLGQKFPWTKFSLDKSPLGQTSPWTIAPWTIVATPPRLGNFHEIWRTNAEWRQLELARRGGKQHERLSGHTKEVKQMEVGDNVMVQNLLANNPNR